MTTIDNPTPADRPVAGELPPLLASWLKSWPDFAATVSRALHRGTHRTGWHLLRLPLYVGRLVLYSPRGLGRLARAMWDVLTDAELRPLRVEAVVGKDAQTALRLRKERNERIHTRLVTATTMAGLLGIIVGGLWFLAPGWSLWIAAAGLVLVLGFIGRPLGKPLVKAATALAGNPPPMRAPYVMEALVSLGIPRLTKVDDISLLMDVARVGPGYQVDLELPPGVPASAVQEKRSELSAAMRRELGCVWPAVGTRHEGHLVLYVCDQPMNAAKQSPWPLLKSGQVDLFKPVPLVTDQMGAWVEVTLAYSNGVIGAVPRMGKTFFLRQLLLVAGLDPRCRVYAIDGKGTGDLSPCSLFAHYIGVGDEPEDIDEQLDAMRALRVELRRRAKVIRNLPREQCPESKVTSDLANRRDLGLEPIVVGVDETQVWFQYGDKSDKGHKAIRDEFASIVTDLVKRGPALGIWVFLATQQVNADTVPTAISNNAVIRFCLKVFGVVANDQVLGTGARKAGVDATMFSTADKGIGYLRADGAESRIVRTVAGMDAVASEKVALRARALREAAGRLTGQAVDDVLEAEAEQVVLLDDCREVMDAEQSTRMTLGEIRDRLALLRPGIYSHLDNDALGGMLRQAGVVPSTVWSPTAKSTGKGVKREQLDVSTTEVIGPIPDNQPAVNGVVVNLTRG